MTTLGTAARRVAPLLAATAGLVLTAGPASAHTAFVGSSVPPGAVVPAGTSQVLLTFSGDVRAELSSVVVTGPDGSEGSFPLPVVRDATVLQTLTAPLDAGAWTLAYRVVAADGHPLTGTVPFRVAGGAAPATSGAAPGTSGTTPGAGATDIRPTRPASTVPEAAPDPVGSSSGSSPVLPVAGLAVGGSLLGLLLLRGRRPRP